MPYTHQVTDAASADPDSTAAVYARRGKGSNRLHTATLGGFLCLALATLACNATAPTATLPPTPAPPTHAPVATTPAPTRLPAHHLPGEMGDAGTAAPTPTPTPPPPSTTAPTYQPANTPTNPPTPTPTLVYTGPGCLRPPDDYTRVEVNGETLNARTLWMLQQAAALYAGPADLLRVTQGSYSAGESTSFGTHAGGGAVDISIRNPADPAEILWDETDAMVLALRQAGFAAWYRAPGDLGEGSPAHIHAIAVGDVELSPPAVEQLTGPGGYFRGLDGLPPEYGGPHPDLHGGPVVCPWMTELGY